MQDDSQPFFYLAPIKGITDRVFRTVLARHFGGLDAAMAPFISTVGSRKLKASYLNDIAPHDTTSLPVIPQLLGNDGDDLLWLARRILDLGYETVNWNLGCPVPMVARKRRGSGLLPHPDLIRRVLDTVCAALPGRISIKTRLGRETDEELVRLLPIFNQYPLREIIIHPRLGVQMYKGTVDLDAFDRCLALCRHPLVYNGDITDTAFFAALRRRFPGIRRFMIGRGVLQNPFLPEILTGSANTALKTNERTAIVQNFHDDLLAACQERLSGPGHLLGRMKAIWFYLSQGFDDPRRAWKLIKKSRGHEAYRRAVAIIFSEMKFHPRQGSSST